MVNIVNITENGQKFSVYTKYLFDNLNKISNIEELKSFKFLDGATFNEIFGENSELWNDNIKKRKIFNCYKKLLIKFYKKKANEENQFIHLINELNIEKTNFVYENKIIVTYLPCDLSFMISRESQFTYDVLMLVLKYIILVKHIKIDNKKYSKIFLSNNFFFDSNIYDIKNKPMVIYELLAFKNINFCSLKEEDINDLYNQIYVKKEESYENNIINHKEMRFINIFTKVVEKRNKKYIDEKKEINIYKSNDLLFYNTPTFKYTNINYQIFLFNNFFFDSNIYDIKNKPMVICELFTFKNINFCSLKEEDINDLYNKIDVKKEESYKDNITNYKEMRFMKNKKNYLINCNKNQSFIFILFLKNVF